MAKKIAEATEWEVFEGKVYVNSSSSYHVADSSKVSSEVNVPQLLQLTDIDSSRLHHRSVHPIKTR